MSATERRGSRGPARRALTPEQREGLSGAAEARRRAEQDYIAAVVAARQSGATNAAIAEAVGVSEDAVRQMVKRYA